MTDVTVVGLGKIGLPLAVQFASRGLRVHGADISESTVATIAAGREPFPGEAGLASGLTRALADGLLDVTTDTASAVASSDVVVVVVPLVVDRDARPDFRALDAATDAIGGALRPGTLVSYETTLPVHTTRARFTPALAARSGLTVGESLFVCHSPERVFSGRIFADLRRYPKLVGGVDGASAKRAVAFYEQALEFDDRDDLRWPNGVWDLGSAEAAELAKLAETTYRDINIAYANELAAGAAQLGVDVLPIIEACNSQPFSHIHTPGIAVGGHCIPVYPHFLLESVDGFALPAVARKINKEQPKRAVDAVAAALGGLDGARIAVLGLAYRSGVKEHAFSGAFDLVRELTAQGAVASVHDPLYDDDELTALGLRPHHRGDPADAVILHTDHAEYETWSSRDVPGVRVVYDGRFALSAEAWPDAVVLGSR